MARHGAELLPEDSPEDLRRAFESYLASLRFERGLSMNSIDAYARDLARYGTWLADEGVSRLGEVGPFAVAAVCVGSAVGIWVLIRRAGLLAPG